MFWANQGPGRPNDLDTHSGHDPIYSNLLVGIDPLFVDAANDDFHLTCFSPAIDAGTHAAPVLPLTDIDGEPRSSGQQVDIGPDELMDPGVFPSYCMANANSSGLAARISGAGCLSISRNEMRITVEGLPGTPGLLLYGPNQLQVTFGDGFRCVGGAVRRRPRMSGGGSSISIDLDLPTLLISPGVQANFQYWYRDGMAGGAGFNLSDAIQVDFTP